MGYNPSESRVPAGSPDGGQWGAGGGGKSTAFNAQSPLEKGKASKTSTDPHEITNLNYDKGSKQWLRQDGQPVNPNTAQRLKDVAAKPGYANVSLNPDPHAGLQAKGVDTKGRVQFMYSKQHSEVAAAEKFARLQSFTKDLPGIRAGIKAEVAKGNESAHVLAVIDKTGIRVGSDRETGGATKAFGASTLLGSHITLGDNHTVTLQFPGKHGVINNASFQDKAIHEALTAKNLQPGDRAFNTNDAGVRTTMKAVAGPEYSPKDFRTYHGTAVALREVAKYPVPTSGAEANKVKMAVAKVVAEHLNNTPTVALKSYINPAVFKTWGKGKG